MIIYFKRKNGKGLKGYSAKQLDNLTTFYQMILTDGEVVLLDKKEYEIHTVEEA